MQDHKVQTEPHTHFGGCVVITKQGEEQQECRVPHTRCSGCVAYLDPHKGATKGPPYPLRMHDSKRHPVPTHDTETSQTTYPLQRDPNRNPRNTPPAPICKLRDRGPKRVPHPPQQAGVWYHKDQIQSSETTTHPRRTRVASRNNLRNGGPPSPQMATDEPVEPPPNPPRENWPVPHPLRGVWNGTYHP
ncbi:hypothetical protein BS47DRAFT_1362894 [Hydnum rufescens UP504]|uniref:Uncharacterized protein n=1 Tax=Hydnum rufescens UP504 TaxID=1448309 RepID=A0A9P6AW24_9AGAM|nr:hypothetical protein BS47DRAFT_1362894 [Hydnum rufescens UP504]